MSTERNLNSILRILAEKYAESQLWLSEVELHLYLKEGDGAFDKLDQMLSILIKDGYIIERKFKATDKEYTLSIPGLDFIKRDGYVGERKRGWALETTKKEADTYAKQYNLGLDAYNQRNISLSKSLVVLTRWIVFLGSTAFVYYLLEILSLFFPNCRFLARLR